MSNIRVSRTILFSALAAFLLTLLPSSAVAAEHFGFGVGFYGPVAPYGYWGGPWGYPYYYGPYGYPYGAYYPYGYYGRPLGEVHIKTPVADAQIYVNGSYAGLAHDLKKFYLAPGTYDIEQHIGHDVQRQRIYVIAYRSVKLEFGKAGTPSPTPVPPPPDVAQPPRYNSPYGAPPQPYGAPPNGAPEPNPAQPNAEPQPAPEQPQQPPEPAPQSAPAPEGEGQNQ